MISCQYVGRCGGCPWGARPLEEQTEEKLQSVRELHADVRFVYSPVERVRDRADLVWENRDGHMRLGLYGRETREVVDIESCRMMTEPLEQFFLEFRTKAPPIVKGSVRLRISPQGERGVWLDFANTDVKALFEEKEYLKWLSSFAFVEIGQRRKALTWKEGQPKLVDPVLKPWFETYAADGKPIPLLGPVGGFSQTGFEANRALIEAVAHAVSEASAADGAKINAWLELFCGNGNITLALAARGYEMEAVEMDELAIEGIRLSTAAIAELSANAELNAYATKYPVKIQRADVYLKSQHLPDLNGRGLIVDPPRAGLRETLKLIENGARPQALVYVSCFTEIFIQDCLSLAKLGYDVKSIVGVDQFPHSPHAEWVALLLPRS